jgi:hypothetical protein
MVLPLCCEEEGVALLTGINQVQTQLIMGSESVSVYPVFSGDPQEFCEFRKKLLGMVQANPMLLSNKKRFCQSLVQKCLPPEFHAFMGKPSSCPDFWQRLSRCVKRNYVKTSRKIWPKYFFETVSKWEKVRDIHDLDPFLARFVQLCNTAEQLNSFSIIEDH